MARVKTTLDIQNDAIRSVCEAVASHMIAFNNESNGEAFRSFSYAGKTITADVRAETEVAKKFDDLVNGAQSEVSLPYAERNLIVALLQKNAIKVFSTASAEYEQEQKKLAREKELVARAKKAATDPDVKKGRAKRVSDPSIGTVITSGTQPDENIKMVNISAINPIVTAKEPEQTLDVKINSALSQLGDLEDSEPTL